MDASAKVYIALSLMMFFQFAVWGAWAPVLAARLLGPLKMSGKQTGWIYTTLPLACIFAPLVAGQLADRYFNLEWILAAAHLIAAIMMFIAVRQKTFGALFAAMLGWSICYAGTLPLVNTALFSHMKEFATLFPNMTDVSGTIFIWCPIGWAFVGYSLSGWRMLRSKESDGTDAMVLSTVLGVVMAACCLLLPATAPAKTGDSSMQPLFDVVKSPDFLVFLITSLCVAGTMQFYFVGSGQYMMDRGISGKAVPGAMALAQVAQAIATWFAMGWAIKHLDYKWTLVLGTSSWVLMYIIYAVSALRPVIFVSQVLHGVAYVMFMILTQVYCGAIAPEGTGASMQALIFAATVGVGLFLGTQLAGFAMDRHKADGKFQWPKIWAYPLVITLAGALVFATVFQGKVPDKPAPTALPKKLAVDLGGAVKIELVLIPAGEFLMGWPDSEKSANSGEKPQHRVRITKPFYLGKFLVTQEQWAAVMDNNPSRFKGPKNPVETVTWNDCQKFLEKLNSKIGTQRGKFVLPTEAQWEYACRAGSTTRFCFGDDESGLGEYAWYGANSDSKTHPVGEKKPNAWGLYDMHGNVWQCCADWYDGGYYANSPTDDPTGPATGSYRVGRGGGVGTAAGYCRSADRGIVLVAVPGIGEYPLGLRVSLVPADE